MAAVIEVYVQTMDRYWGLGDEVSEDEHLDALDRMQRYIDQHEHIYREGIRAYVRDLRDGEIDGIYLRRPDGSEQILGGTIPVPEEVAALYAAAWEHACTTWRTR